MTTHILNGDGMVESFLETKLGGEIIVCRECLVEGEIKANNLEDFWKKREEFLSNNYRKPDGFYRQNVVSEFKKIIETSSHEVNLWFGDDLFCQVNMWFCISLLSFENVEIYRVLPFEMDFGINSPVELTSCFENRIRFTKSDFELANDLWKAFCLKDFELMQILNGNISHCFPKLKEVCTAAIEQETRPKKTLQKIISKGNWEFREIFQEFSSVEAIYGFGDLQVRKIYDQLSEFKA